MLSMDKLNLGDTFPEMSLTTTAGDQITLPTDIESPFAIVLFYRGHW